VPPTYPTSGRITSQVSQIFQEGYGIRSSQVYNVFLSSKNLTQLVYYLQSLIIVLEEGKFPDPNNTAQKRYNKFIQDLQAVTKTAPLINVEVIKRKSGTLLYPAGAKLLDEAVVNEVLLWLENYPASLKPFEQALALYQSKIPDQQRELLDNLRLALEKLLQTVLGNRKSLENQKEILSPWLRNLGVHQQVINMYLQLLFGSYRIYQNEAVKHDDASSIIEVEFMIYLTGTFMRLLTQLHEMEP